MDRRRLILWVFGAVACMWGGYARAWGVAIASGTAIGGAPAPATPEYKSSFLAAYWRMEEASGTRADSVGANDASDGGTTGQGTGKQGNCADFESGDLDYLEAADDAALQPTTGVAVSVWIKPESLGSGTGYWVLQHGDAVGGTYTYSVTVNADNTVAFALRDGVGAHTAYGGSLSTGTWYHVVGVASGGSVYLYIDGAAQTSDTYDDTIDDPGDPPVLSFGRSSYGAVAHFDGLIDEVGIWKDITFTGSGSDTVANFVASLYNAGSGVSLSTIMAPDYTTDLVARWVGSASVAPEGTWPDSAQSYDGTLVGDAYVDDAEPGVILDGLDDFPVEDYDSVQIPNIAELVAANDFTLTFWVKTSDSSNNCMLAYSENSLLNPGAEGDLYVYTPGSLRYGGIGSQSEVNTGVAVNDGNWHFVAISKSATHTLVYFDGEAVAANDQGTSNNANAYTSATWRIGDAMNVSALSGSVDDVRIYDATLTSLQIRQIYWATQADH